MLLQRFDLAEAVAGRAQPHVLVADFGLAELCEGDHSGSQLKGSPLYLAPEAGPARGSKLVLRLCCTGALVVFYPRCAMP